MVGQGIIEIINYPTLSPSDGVVTFSVRITAIGGDITNPSIGVSANTGPVPQFWNGLDWVLLDTSIWQAAYGAQADTIPSGTSLTITQVKLKFPVVTEDTVSLVDFISGYYDGSDIFQTNGTKVTKATTVIPRDIADYTTYYIIAALGVAVAAVLGYTILSRKK